MNRFTTKSLILFIVLFIICMTTIKKDRKYFMPIFIILYIIFFVILFKNYKYNISNTLKNKITEYSEKRVNFNDFLGNFQMYFINLDRAYERNNYMIDQKHKYNLRNLLRVEGVDGKNIKNLQQDVYRFKNGDILHFDIDKGYNSHNHGELGCLLSHLYAIYKAYHNGDQFAYIMEDDIFFGMVNTWKTGIHEFLQYAPTDWNLLQLYSMNSKVITEVHMFKKRVLDDWSTCVYLINRNAMHYIVSTLFVDGKLVIKKHPKIQPKFGIGNPLNADYFIYNYIEHGIGGVYVTKPLFISNDLMKGHINFKQVEHIENAVHIMKKIKI